MTKKQDDLIEEKLNRTRNPQAIARMLDVKISEVRAVMKTVEINLPGWGRLSMQRNIVSRRSVDQPWPVVDAKVLAEHRVLHDQGRVTMCQGRDGEYILQYAIPNNPPVRRDSYFTAEGS
jgi:hypothetical protein